MVMTFSQEEEEDFVDISLSLAPPTTIISLTEMSLNDRGVLLVLTASYFLEDFQPVMSNPLVES
jgi:hypothetical protein